MTVAVIIHKQDIKSMINTQYMARRRYELGLSLADVEAICEISRDQICRIENGKVNPWVSTVVALCKALQTEPNKLIQWETSNGD